MADYKRKMGIEEDKDSEAYYRERFNRQTSKPGKYDSVRPAGEEERLSKRKSEGLKQAAMGTAMAPAVIGLETAMGGSDTRGKGPIGAGVSHLAGTGDRLAKSVKEAKDFIGGGVNQYRKAKSEEAGLDRELENQIKRESRKKEDKEEPMTPGQKQSMEEAKDEEMRKKMKNAPTTRTEMGKVFAKGGMTASRRADGIAQRGKTRGTLIK